MRIAIIVSSKDPAGMNIRDQLLARYPFHPTPQIYDGTQVHALSEQVALYTAAEDSVHCEHIDQQIPADLFIFATKHQSESGVHSLSVHAPGNWGTAQYGGQDNKLCVAPASYLKHALKILSELGKQTDLEVIQECTHHGPYLHKPVFFIEIGSSLEQWRDPALGSIIAQAIHRLVTTEPKTCRAALGIGGLHHTPNFKKIELESDIAIGHVCPKYMLAGLTKELIIQAMERTMPKADLIILDWKGMAEHKQRIIEIVDTLGVEIKRTKDY